MKGVRWKLAEGSMPLKGEEDVVFKSELIINIKANYLLALL
jgi:hypothetical protein